MIKELILIVFTATILVGWMKYTMNLNNKLAEEMKITSSYEYFVKEELGINYTPPQLAERRNRLYVNR